MLANKLFESNVLLLYLQMKYGVLLTTYQLATGQTFCIVQGVEEFMLHNGTAIMNQFDCPVLNLTKSIITTESANIKRAVSFVHECSASCVYKEVTSVHNVEREEAVQKELILQHDYSNTSYCLNVYCIC